MDKWSVNIMMEGRDGIMGRNEDGLMDVSVKEACNETGGGDGCDGTKAEMTGIRKTTGNQRKGRERGDRWDGYVEDEVNYGD